MNNDRTIIFNTECKNCIFADLHNGVQVDCTAGKLDQLINKGRAKKVGNFYKIEGLCQSCRNTEWFNSNNMEGKDYDELFKKIKEENRVRHDLIIDYLSEISQLDNLLKRFSELGNVFDNIYVITNTPDFKEIEKVIKNYYKDTKFKVTFDVLKNKENIIRHILGKSKSFFYSLVDSSFEPVYNYTGSLTKYIVDDLNEISMILSEDITTVQIMLYNLLKDDTRPIKEKVEYLCIQQEKMEMIKTWEEICE
jgi:hypothetical protein